MKVIREGAEYDQGVGYLDDGTMIVVEGGRSAVGKEVTVEVTSVLQSPSGQDDLHQAARPPTEPRRRRLGARA